MAVRDRALMVDCGRRWLTLDSLHLLGCFETEAVVLLTKPLGPLFDELVAGLELLLPLLELRGILLGAPERVPFDFELDLVAEPEEHAHLLVDVGDVLRRHLAGRRPRRRPGARLGAPLV